MGTCVAGALSALVLQTGGCLSGGSTLAIAVFVLRSTATVPSGAKPFQASRAGAFSTQATCLSWCCPHTWLVALWVRKGWSGFQGKTSIALAHPSLLRYRQGKVEGASVSLRLSPTGEGLGCHKPGARLPTLCPSPCTSHLATSFGCTAGWDEGETISFLQNQKSPPPWSHQPQIPAHICELPTGRLCLRKAKPALPLARSSGSRLLS